MGRTGLYAFALLGMTSERGIIRQMIRQGSVHGK